MEFNGIMFNTVTAMFSLKQLMVYDISLNYQLINVDFDILISLQTRQSPSLQGMKHNLPSTLV